MLCSVTEDWGCGADVWRSVKEVWDSERHVSAKIAGVAAVTPKFEGVLLTFWGVSLKS